MDIPVSIFGLTVHPNDLIIADRDGVTVVPNSHAVEIVALARQKATMENSARDLLLGGGYLRDVWTKYQVL